MTKRNTKTAEKSRRGRMLAAVVPIALAADFERIAQAHERTVAAELRTLIRAHVEHHAEPTGAAA